MGVGILAEGFFRAPLDAVQEEGKEDGVRNLLRDDDANPLSGRASGAARDDHQELRTFFVTASLPAMAG